LLMVTLGTVQEEVVVRRHHADTDDVVVQRNVPEPALLAGGGTHERGALVAAGVALGALPVSPQGRLLQDQVPLTQPQPTLDHRALATGIDDHPRPYLALCAGRIRNPHADGAAALEEYLEDAYTFMHLNAVLPGVTE